MSIIVHILISIVFYLVLLFLSVNLLGFLVRGLFSNPELDRLKLEGHEVVKHEIEKFQRSEKYVNIIALILIIAYLYVLSHFWNIGVMVVAIILMASRLSDLFWEIKHGKKIDKTAPKNVWFYIDTILTFGAFPVLYYFLYYF